MTTEQAYLDSTHKCDVCGKRSEKNEYVIRCWECDGDASKYHPKCASCANLYKTKNGSNACTYLPNDKIHYCSNWKKKDQK